MKKYKYKLGNGLAHCESKDIQMLEDMAAQGYALEKVSKFGYYKFRADKSDGCTYAVDFSDIEAKDEGFEQYVEIFNASGWKYVTSIDNIHYFKAPIGTKPIYSDSTSLAEKYVKMQKICMWWVVVSGIFVAACVASYFIFSQFFLLPLLGAGVGLCWTMYDGMLLNKRRVAQLRDGISTSSMSDACKEISSAEKYDELSKSCGQAFLWSVLVVAGTTVLNWMGFLGLIPVGDGLNTVIGSIIGFIWGSSIIYAIYKASGFFANRRKAARLRKA